MLDLWALCHSDLAGSSTQLLHCRFMDGLQVGSPYIFKGSLEVKLPTIWRDEKQRREK